MKINQIWKDLESDKTFTSGLLLRRYSSAVLPNVFIALKAPERYRCIATILKDEVVIDIAPFDKLQDISLEIIADGKTPNQNILLIKLTSQEHKDIFSVLGEDLISSICSEQDEKRLLGILLNRFEKWKSLFAKVGFRGLSLEEQRGLFGELYFLRKFVEANKDFQYVVSSWVGVAKEIRDFQMNDWAVEVKTTHGNNHQKIHVSSERQLDNTHIEHLFLFHLSLEKVQETGETLNQLIDSVLQILESDSIALYRFKTKLYEVGYFEHHYHLYNSIGYFIRNNTFYRVENDFPRIQENEIRSGVGDVKYSIVLSLLENYIQTEESVFKTLNV